MASLVFLNLVLFLLLMGWGATEYGLSDLFSGDLEENARMVLLDLRLPRAMTSFIAGAALAVAGLLMQALFRNPLAGPFILGIHSGSSLLVALWILVFSQSLDPWVHSLGSLGFSIIGSLLTLGLLLVISNRFKSSYFLILFGVILGYVAGGVVNFLISISDSQLLKNFAIWSLGSFSRTAASDIPLFLFPVSLCLVLAMSAGRQLDLMLLGERQARTTGVNVNSMKLMIIGLSGVLSGTVIAFCGPVSFVGVVAPHLSRMFLKTSSHRSLALASVLVGGGMTLFVEWISGLPSEFPLPVNALMGVLGGPVLIYILWKGRKGALQ